MFISREEISKTFDIKEFCAELQSAVAGERLFLFRFIFRNFLSIAADVVIGIGVIGEQIFKDIDAFIQVGISDPCIFDPVPCGVCVSCAEIESAAGICDRELNFRSVIINDMNGSICQESIVLEF